MKEGENKEETYGHDKDFLGTISCALSKLSF